MIFESVLVSINALFPQLHKGKLDTANISLSIDWMNTMRKLRSIIEIEIKDRSLNRRHRLLQESFNDEKDIFIQLGARVVYIVTTIHIYILEILVSRGNEIRILCIFSV